MALPTALIQPWFRLTRGMTLGVRGLVVDAGNRVLLVRQTYAPGLVLPGGGVERGETLLQSLERELHEEANVRATQPPVLFGVYSNETAFRGDHVAVFVVRAFEAHPFTPTREISEAAFHDRARLPADVSQGTARRIAEVLDGLPPSPHW
jgi:ADP-ribose pyrophosphatase YjhB (NUDIX family)